MTPLPFALLATLLLGLGFACLNAQKHFFRWREDRALDRLAGACWGLALVCLAWAVVVMTEANH
jgi:hypothetical protein